MSRNAAHHSIWQTSDAIVVATVGLGVILQYGVGPLDIIPLSATPRIAMGMAIAMTGIVAIVLAKREFRNANQPSAPGRATTGLVETGLFRLSRNPLYLGLLFAVAGSGLALNNTWLIILTPPMAGVMQRILIVPEERYLLATFGDRYRHYLSRVRRWF